MKKIITLSALLALSLYAKDIEIKDAFQLLGLLIW